MALENFKNLHLVPQAIIDVAGSLMSHNTRDDKTNFLHRLEVTRDYCDTIINQYHRHKMMKYKSEKSK
jgi:hypothetical protein